MFYDSSFQILHYLLSFLLFFLCFIHTPHPLSLRSFVQVYRVEMYALVTNYFTFYLALFLAGNTQIVLGAAWSNVVGVALIAGNVTFVIYYIYMYRATFVNKVRKEKRNLKLMVRAIRGRAVNGWKYLKRDKPPVHSIMSVRVDANVVETINSIRRVTSMRSMDKRTNGSSRGGSNTTSGAEEQFSDVRDGWHGKNKGGIDELAMMIGERVLPEGWEEFMDATSGFFFWVNELSGESTWDPPPGMIGDDPNPTIVERLSQMELSPMKQ